jgi:hypothetical protein
VEVVLLVVLGEPVEQTLVTVVPQVALDLQEARDLHQASLVHLCPVLEEVVVLEVVQV